MSSSMLTNSGAITALRTLQATSRTLAVTQDRISTGLKVGSAKDNAAAWSISSSFRVDAAASRVVSESLGVAISTVSLARGTAERAVEMLDTVYGKALARAEMVANGDPNAAVMSSEIGTLGEALGSMLSNASFNGINLLTASGGSAGTPSTGQQELWFHIYDGILGFGAWYNYNATNDLWSVAGSGPTAQVSMLPVDPITNDLAGYLGFDGTNWIAHSVHLTGNVIWEAASNPWGIDIQVGSGTPNPAGPVNLAPATTGTPGSAVVSDATFLTDGRGGTFTVANANLNINISASSTFSQIEAALTAARQAAANLGAAQ